MKPSRDKRSDGYRQSIWMYMLLRGPLIAWSCFAALIYRALQLATLEVQILTSILLCGCALSILDWLSMARKKIESIKTIVRNYEDTIVLDTLLRDTFSVDKGIFGCIFGGFGLYNLPFTPQQRTRILQFVLPEAIPVVKTFFQPGGIRNLLAASWSKTGEGEKVTPCESINTLDQNRSNINDLFWDDLVEHSTASCTDDDGNGDDDVNSTQSSDMVTENGLGLYSSPVSEDYSKHASCQDVSSTSSKSYGLQSFPQADHASASHGTNGRTESIPTCSSDDTWSLIVRDFLTTTLESCFSHMDESLIRNTGVAAASLFFLQMRMSSSSRRVFVRTIQGLFSFGLVGVASGCLSLWYSKRYLMDKSKTEEIHRNHRKSNPDVSRNFSILSTFYFIKKFLDQKLKRDHSWLKWKGILAAVVFLYIGRMRHLRQRKFLRSSK